MVPSDAGYIYAGRFLRSNILIGSERGLLAGWSKVFGEDDRMKDDGQMIGGKKMAGKKETDSRSTENRIKLFDSELKLMELLWANEGATAKELAVLAADQIGWNKNTTYTVIKKLVAKGAIKRTEPNFVCHSLITREEVGRDEARKVLRSFFGGSVKMLFSSFMADGTLSDEEAEELRKLIDEHSRS